LAGRSRIGKTFEFGADVGGLRRPNPLEDLQRAAQPVFCLGGVAGRKSAPAQASQRVGLIPGAVDLPGKAQSLLVAGPGPRQVPADPVQRPELVQGLDLTAPIADVAADAQRLLQSPGRPLIVPGYPPHDPQEGKCAGLAAPVADVAVNA
jgi:hypothetical protein